MLAFCKQLNLKHFTLAKRRAGSMLVSETLRLRMTRLIKARFAYFPVMAGESLDTTAEFIASTVERASLFPEKRSLHLPKADCYASP